MSNQVINAQGVVKTGYRCSNCDGFDFYATENGKPYDLCSFCNLPDTLQLEQECAYCKAGEASEHFHEVNACQVCGSRKQVTAYHGEEDYNYWCVYCVPATKGA